MQGEKTVAVSSGENEMKVFRYLENFLKNTQVTLRAVSPTEKADIYLLIDNSLKDEAYTLEVASDAIRICSNETAAGLFYGVQSLLQLMPAEIYASDRRYEGRIEIPIVSIKDAPRFPYRGALMDVLSWSSTERMSAQQADVLTSEIDAYRRILTPVVERICRTYLLLEGTPSQVEVEWDDAMLQDNVELARAELYAAQAEKIRKEIENGE